MHVLLDLLKALLCSNGRFEFVKRTEKRKHLRFHPPVDEKPPWGFECPQTWVMITPHPPPPHPPTSPPRPPRRRSGSCLLIEVLMAVDLMERCKTSPEPQRQCVCVPVSWIQRARLCARRSAAAALKQEKPGGEGGPSESCCSPVMNRI